MPKEKFIIYQKTDLILRKTATSVKLEEFGTKKLNKIIQCMKDAVESQDDGVAIAAPQIGQSLRIFVISHRVFEMTKKYADKAGYDMVFINPKISKLSKEKKIMEEGCLSVRYLYGKVNRSNKATIIAQDEVGRSFTMGGSGLLAQIFQHETDHLDGVLFIDKAKDVEEVLPKDTK
jgi:peptide deformylase